LIQCEKYSKYFNKEEGKGDVIMAQIKNLPRRNEVDLKFTWAIEDLYASDELWQKEYEKVKEMLPKAMEYSGRLTKSAELLLNFLQLTDDISKLMERVYVYANQKCHEDTKCNLSGPVK